VMLGSLAFPLLVTLGVAAIATSAHRRLPPRLAARFITITLGLVVAAALPTALIVAVAFLAHVPVVGIGFQWCTHAIGLHGAISPWIGVPALALVAIGVVRTVRLVRQHRALRLDHAHPIHIAQSHKPYAVTLPGRAGQIVISTAMLDMLDDAERRIVVAHEEAHARYRHDRYLLAAELATAVLPPLRALARRVNFSIERWADEEAVAACGDRRLVAVTLGKVALQSHPPIVAGFAGLGVAARMEALLAPPISKPHRSHLVLLWSSLVVTAAFSLYQIHHLEKLITALCPH
jgi:Zn-dependent protease with chaperone function